MFAKFGSKKFCLSCKKKQHIYFALKRRIDKEKCVMRQFGIFKTTKKKIDTGLHMVNGGDFRKQHPFEACYHNTCLPIISRKNM